MLLIKSKSILNDFIALKDSGKTNSDEYKLAIETMSGPFVTNKIGYDKLINGKKLDVLDQYVEGVFNTKTGEYDFKEGQEVHLVIDVESLKDTEYWELSATGHVSVDERIVDFVTHEAKHTVQDYHDPGPALRKKNNEGTFDILTKDEIQVIENNLNNDAEKGGEKAYNNYLNQRNEVEVRKSGEKAVKQFKAKKKN